MMGAKRRGFLITLRPETNLFRSPTAPSASLGDMGLIKEPAILIKPSLSGYQHSDEYDKEIRRQPGKLSSSFVSWRLNDPRK